MECYIRVVDGVPYEHPIIKVNMEQAFPDIDLDNLPPEFNAFVRVPAPELGVYEKNQTVSYERVEGMAGTYTDVFSCEDMTAEEITAKQDAVKAGWAEDDGFASWVFNEETCSFDPPTPKPEDLADQIHVWSESTLSWVAVSYPWDGEVS